MTVQLVSVVGARSAAPAPSTPAELYNFDRPVSLGREQTRALMAGLDAFARQWNIEFAARVRAPSLISAVDVNLMTYDDYVTALPGDSALMLCSVAGLPGRAIVQVPQAPALNWVARMLGGTGAREIASRSFSPIEQAILARTMNDAFELLRYAMGDDLPASIRVESFNYVPQTAQAANPTDSLIVAAVDVAVDSASARITIAIPSAALATPLEGSHTGADGAPAAGFMRAQLASVPVRVSLQFEPTNVRPEVVLGLAEGDVIRLAHSKNRPLNFAAEGQVMARAAVGASGEQLACVIVDTHEPNGTGTP